MKASLIQMVRVQIKGREELLTLNEAHELIHDLTALTLVNASSADIVIAKVCAEFGVQKALLQSPRRTAHIAWARQVAMYLIKRLTDLTYCEIGAAFPNGKYARDHGTVSHAIDAVEVRMETNEQDRIRIANLQAAIYSETKKQERAK